MAAGILRTVKGDVRADMPGLILPHEHIFYDLRRPADTPGHGAANPDHVAAVMTPYLAAAYAAGVRALVACTTIGVGRNVGVFRAVAAHTPIHIIAPTGLYRDAYTPPALRNALIEFFIPLLRRHGADQEVIDTLTITNPARAFAFS